MENALKAKPFEVKELYEKQIKDLQERYLSKKLSGIFKQPIVNCLTSDSLCPG